MVASRPPVNRPSPPEEMGQSRKTRGMRTGSLPLPAGRKKLCFFSVGPGWSKAKSKGASQVGPRCPFRHSKTVFLRDIGFAEQAAEISAKLEPALRTL